MTINKILAQYSQSQKLEETKNKKAEKKAEAKKADNAYAKVELSTEGKKLQEKSSVLTKALKQLESFNDFRNGKLSEVKSKIDKDFYLSDDFDKLLAETLTVDEEDNFVPSFTAEDFKQQIKQIEEKYDFDASAINSKIESGEYESPEVNSIIADKLLNIIF